MQTSRSATAGLAAQISALDRAAGQRIAGTDSRVLDLVTPRLSRLADHGVLWVVLAAALLASGDAWASRAAGAARAVLPQRARWSISSARRFPRAAVPVSWCLTPGRCRSRGARRSGPGAASAAAFATGVSLEMPSLAAPMIALAAAVAASRVAAGVHYLSDVMAGAFIGGTAGVLTLRWWPQRPAAAIRPPRVRPLPQPGKA